VRVWITDGSLPGDQTSDRCHRSRRNRGDCGFDFGRLSAAYNGVDRHIWRFESDTLDEELEKLMKRLLLPNDDMAALLMREQ